MTHVGILTDTAACVPDSLVQELEIERVSFYVIRGQENLRDLIDIQPDEFAVYLEHADKLPTTSCPNPNDYLAGLKRLAERTREIVALTLTATGSGAYASCCAAANLLREQRPDVVVHVIDTQQVAMSLGWAVIQAARAARQGLTLNEVLARARAVAQQGLMLQTADTLRYLYMGGRIMRAQHLIGTLLNIKPIIGMEDGVIVALGTARSRARAYARMADLACERLGEGARVRIAFTHCTALEQLELLKAEILKRFDCVELIITPLSPVLSVHSGPGTVGVSLIPAGD